MRRQFNSSYDDAVSLVKQLKNSNDCLNRAIGIESPTAITLRLKRQTPAIHQILQKTEALVQKLEQSYLDPDTARKIGTIKQQFRIQRDRRKQLLHSVEAEEKNDRICDRTSKDSQMTTFSSMGIQNTRRSAGENRSRVEERLEEPVTKKRKESMEDQQNYDEMGVNFELQHRIMRERNEEISHVSTNLMNVHNIMQQTSNLAFQQGQKLDIIGEDLFETYRNAKQARENISEASEHQKRARRKYVYLSLFILLALAVVLIILLV